jgi:superfamily II DNA or RNA helicase
VPDLVRVKLDNHSKIKVDSDKGILWELREEFSFFVPGYKFMPAFRAGWDGKIRLFDYKTQSLPAGLYPRLVKYCNKWKYDIELVESDYGEPGAKTKVNPKKVMEFIKSLNLSSKGKPIEVRDYQFDAICRAIQDRRLLLLSPTGSGKSLIIYVLMRWWMAERTDKCLVIVPTTSLVEQMYSDFEDYSHLDKNWNAKDELHKIYSGKEKTNVHEDIYISTWQSIYKLPKTWFEQFGTIFGDEAHGFKSSSLTKSMEKSTNAINRVGTTGTLDGTQTNQLVLEGVFGPVVKVTTTKTLQDKGSLNKSEIHIIDLIYPDEVRQSFGKVPYQSEIDWIVRNQERNKFIRNLALGLDFNTLLLFQFVEKHGKVLHEMIKEKTKHRAFYVSGEVDKSDREAIRHIVENQKKSTITASLGTFSTGINIKNLHNIIFASPSKSQIKVLQSIGRGLRLSENGEITRIYDIVDHLNWGSRKNYAIRHAEERIKIYEKEGFKVIRHKVYMK